MASDSLFPLEEPQSSEGVAEGVVSKVDEDDAEGPSEDAPAKAKSPLVLALLHLRWASFLQSAGRHADALGHFDKSLAQRPSSRAHFGRGTSLASLRRRPEAVEALEEALKINPRYTSAHVNIAGVFLALRRDADAECHCRLALGVDPCCREATMNLANALRNLGRREEALRTIWQRIVEASGSDGPPEPIDCAALAHEEAGQRRPLAVVCVKWGKRYGPEYVNRLHAAVRRHLPNEDAEASFVCFTDDGEGLDERVAVRTLPSGLPLWWGKAYLFSEEAGLDGNRCLFLDLDQVIVASLAPLLTYSGHFALLATDGIACELAAGGYNSSVISWESGPKLRPIHARLTEHVLRYVHRFDHWLEMNVANARLWQDLAPGCIVDYTSAFRGGVCLGTAHEEDELWSTGSFVPAAAVPSADLPSAAPVRDVLLPGGVSLVTFPRFPKPHEVLERHAWVRQHWAAEE